MMKKGKKKKARKREQRRKEEKEPLDAGGEGEVERDKR